LGVHHPADILAGAALGVGAGIATHLVVMAVQR
jgi:membrane-associated phospholipid phosphatase